MAVSALLREAKLADEPPLGIIPTGPRPRYRGDGGAHRRRSHHGVALFLAVVVVAAAGIGAYVERHEIRREVERLEGKSAAPTTSPSTTVVKPKQAPLAAVAASVEPWQLPTPIQGALVMPGPSGELLVTGGEVASGSAGNGAFLVSTSTGKLNLYANLVSGVYDTAGANLAGNEYVFGGLSGSPSATISTVESFAAPGTGSAPGSVNATTSGALPAARAGEAAVTVGAAVYIVGGYDGPAPDQQVLATSDGTSYAVVAKLPVPVRDAAVTATGGQIYVFGGEALAGGRWTPVADIQHVDPVTGKSAVVGHLPAPLEGGVAVNLAGRVYVAAGHGPAGFNSTIYGFAPATGELYAAGHLPHAVSDPGYTVKGGTAWLVGGNSAAGQPVGWIQTFHLSAGHVIPVARPGPAKKPAKSS